MSRSTAGGALLAAFCALPLRARAARPDDGRPVAGVRAERRRRDEPAARDDAPRLAVLQQGGNAIDAAVTAAAVLVRRRADDDRRRRRHVRARLEREGEAARRAQRERARRLADDARRAREARPHAHASAASRRVTVPGALAGWDALLKKYGTITLAQAVQPAIGYAENGFLVTPVISGDWAGQRSVLARDDGAQATFLVERARRRRRATGSAIPIYARTLRADREGRARRRSTAARSARSIVARIQQLGGFLTLDDLKKNQPTWVTPISTTYKGYRVWELPPNNQGIAALEMLRILEPYDLKAMGQNSRAVSAPSHRGEEARVRRSRAVRRRRGPSHDSRRAACCPTSSSPSGGATRSKHRRQTRVEPGPERTSSETIYLTVADKDGNMVSFINSLFDEFGSGVVVPGTGFALHDRGLGFTMDAGSAEHRRAGQASVPHAHSRRSSRSPGPTSAPDGTGDEPYMSFGLMGGAMQAQGHAQFLINMLVFGMNIQEAMDAGRFRHESGARVIVEPAIADSVIAQLKAMGHDVTIARPSSFGGSQAIIKLTRGYVAGSDPRKDGHAAGY